MKIFQIIALSLFVLLSLTGCGQKTNAVPEREQSAEQTQEDVLEEGQSDERMTETKTANAETQSIDLTGVGNARELGGYASEYGGTVKRGVLLRTAALNGATEDDIRRLQDVYHLSVIADLRMDRELEPAPDPEIPGVKNIQIHIIDEAVLAEKQKNLNPDDLDGLDLSNKMDQLKMAIKAGIVNDQMYIDFLSGEMGREGYKRLFEELLKLPEGDALLFHCTQGKDRTGCAAMLILSALGVDEETIMADYLLTNTFNAALIENERQALLNQGYEGEELETMMAAMDQVNPQYMTNALDWIKNNYGSVTGYITSELGVTDEQLEILKNMYLDA